jgi:branched-chain amino acid aminotransferase
LEDAKISVLDHGLLYGDGVFEGIRAYNRRIFKLDEHLERMYKSASMIDLNIPLSKSEFREKIIEICRINKLSDAYIRPIVTRGVGDFGLDPRKCSTSSVIIIAKEFAPMYGEKYNIGLKIITSSFRRTPAICLDPNIKSLNYLNNIVAKIEANKRGADEALFLDMDGYVCEATADNIFIIKDNTLITPPTDTNLDGVTRATVLQLAENSEYPTMIKLFRLENVYDADEMFITGTAAEIAPVVQVDNRAIGDGKPGKITKYFMKKFKDLVNSTGVDIY